MRALGHFLTVSAGLALLIGAGLFNEGLHAGPKARPTPYPVMRQSDAGIGSGADWMQPQGEVDASYSRLTEVTPANIGRLKLASYLDLPDEVGLEGTPLAIDGILYFSGDNSDVYAVDGLTGKLLWRFNPETWKRSPPRTWSVSRGIAYEKGRLFVGERDGRMSALDAKTGKILWQAESIPPGAGLRITGAPRVMNGKVIIGNGGGDSGNRGFVTAFDTLTGRLLWRFYLAPGKPEENKGNPAMEAAEKTWSGEWWKTGTGGTAWNGMTYDPELDRIYVGSGNAGPWDGAVRNPKGLDNLYISSIVALDATTGKYLWHYQETPNDVWDYKATPNIIMATLNLGGKPRKVLLHAPTNGFFYVIDRLTGKFISGGKTTKITWAKGLDPKTGRPIVAEGARYETGTADIWPGSSGGHNWQAMSYSPGLGLAFIPIIQLGVRFSRTGPDGQPRRNVGISPLTVDENDGHGFLIAWDPVRQREAWRVKHDPAWNGGTLATAGGLVFQGLADGNFDAYNGRTGERLWRFNVGFGIIGAPMSFAIKGKQYVSLLVGYGGVTASMGKLADMGWKYRTHKARLVTFALDGKAKLPPLAPRDYTIHALDDPDLKINPQDIQAGARLAGGCGQCHGPELNAVGMAPDLRESAVTLNLDVFGAYIKAGNQARGMPSFPQFTPDQVRQLHAYVRDAARKAMANPKPTKGSSAVPAI